MRVHRAVHNALQVTGLAHASLSTIWWNVVCTHMRSSLFCTCTVALRLTQGKTSAADQNKFLDETYLNICRTDSSCAIEAWLLVDLVSVLDRYPHYKPEGHPQFACNKDLMCAVIPEQAQGANLQPAWWKNMRFEWTNKLALGASICRSASHGAVQVDQDIELHMYHLRQCICMYVGCKKNFATQPQHHHTKENFAKTFRKLTTSTQGHLEHQAQRIC
jgi:hypothetical protein